MKGIYLTQKAKEEIEAKIKKLKSRRIIGITDEEYYEERGKEYLLEEILSSATILPVEEDWSIVGNKSIKSLIDDQVEEGKGIFEVHYPNGVIIQPKQ